MPITWPIGKHKGELLEDLPTPYLKWVANEKDFSNDYLQKLAKQELEARNGGVPIPPPSTENMPILKQNDDPWDSWLPGTPIPTTPDKPKPKAAKRYSVEIKAVNDASLLLLREFIVRSDKEQSIGEWLEEMAKEAAKFGARTGSTTTVLDGVAHTAANFEHLKCTFLIVSPEENVMVLVGINGKDTP